MEFSFDRLDIGLAGVVLALLLLALRVQVGVALGIVAFVGVSLVTSIAAAWGILTALPYDFVAQWSLSAIPMFLLMGYLAANAGLTQGVFKSANILMGRVPGGLASATVVSSALFASASGSSVATAAAFSKIAVPEMLKAKYNPGLATGSVAAAGTLGALIPPSVLMILYGIFTDTSIGALFIAGVIPGILSALMYILMITVRATITPSLAPISTVAYTREEKRAAFKDIWPLPVLIIAVLAGIFTGVFTPTEAGAVGASMAALIAWFRRSLTYQAVMSALTDTAVGTCTIFIVAIGASMFAAFMSLSTLPNVLGDFLMGSVDGPIAVILMISVFIIILGMFIDAISILLLTIPIVAPVLIGLDVNLIWFGIIMIKLLEIGLITPPVGLNVYVIKSSLGNLVQLIEIFKGVGWFIFMDILVLLLLIAFPVLSLYLPELMR
ncbi:TRAP transporter large permease subunit [Allopusillimonas ginsengisoli]|nr:TRAP transporter large permease subunit [Allopusillimonas ginsengisoli]